LKGRFDRRRRAQLLTGLLGLIAAGSGAQVGWHSERPVRLTVAYPPGGISDETARALAAGLEARLGVAVIVDHRPGAAGAVALEALSRAGADSPVLCFSAITPLLRRRESGAARDDPLQHVAPVAAVMSTPVLVVATPAFEGHSLADLVSAARRAPGRVRWATSGQATTGHLVLEQIRRLAAVDITHVPYSGGGRQINDALAGQFEVLSTNVAALQLAHLRAGRWQALAVGAPQRLTVLPDVPTLAELGYPAANLSSLFGVFAPGRTSTARLDEWNLHINAVLDQPGFRQRLITNGNLPVHASRLDFVRRIASEAAALRETEGGGR
jgi:tripartite-type tricarboxylate transporter receptor subunit TctC